MRKTDTSEWLGILVYLECHDGKIHRASLEMLGEAWRLSRQQEQQIYVVGIGKNMDQVQSKLEGYPVGQAYLYETEDEYVSFCYEKIMVSCIQKVHPAIVLIGGTYEGRALAPGLAVEFQTGLTADCISLQIDEDGNLVQTRPAFGGNVMASIVTQYCRPQFATVRPGVMEQIEPVFSVPIQFSRKTEENRCEEIKIITVKEKQDSDDITSQKLLVVAGRGIRKKEDLQMLRELAELLNGKLASSRALVEKGWMQPAEQIGLSGQTVSPEYMITCGVSGSVQFAAGMKNTKNIIAINTDSDAQIFEIAHYPICADIYEVIPNLIEALKKQKG